MKDRTTTTGMSMMIAMMVMASSTALAQWSTSGNIVSNPGDVLGSTNAADLVMISDNIERLTLTSSGTIATSNVSLVQLNNAALEVANGDVTINNGLFSYTGSAFSVSGTSGINMHNAIGSFNMTSNGFINLMSHNGGLNLTSNFGNITLQTTQGGIELQSTGGPGGGPILLNSNGNPIIFASQGGPIDMDLGAGILTVNGDVTINGSGTYSGTWTSSDARFKTNVAQLDNALAKVMSLRGVAYDWKREEYPARNFTTGRQMGFIAQEVEQVIPEVVTTGRDGYKAVAYQNVTALLTEAIKEQQAQIQAQGKLIQELQAKLARMESALGKGESVATPSGSTTAPSSDIK